MESCKRDKEFSPSGCIFAPFVCDRRKKCDFLVSSLRFAFLSCGRRMFEEIEKCNEANVIPFFPIVPAAWLAAF
jgi:hypothetical protein